MTMTDNVRISHRARPPLRSLLAIVFLPAITHAQCLLSWGPGEGVSGVWRPELDGLARVNAMATWDPDGPGPLGTKIVLGGWFSIAGDVRASNIATFDPASGAWDSLGTGLAGGFEGGGQVLALLPMPDGRLFAGGSFSGGGATSPWSGIAEWNGLGWTPIGGNLGWTPGGSTPGAVRAMAALANGDVVATGDFTSIGGVAANGIARWDGTNWSPYGSGLNFGNLQGGHSLLVVPNGDIVVGGRFQAAGGVPADGIARWDGSSWSGFGNATGWTVRCLAMMPNGDLIAAGQMASPTMNIARWNGATWSTLNTGVNGIVYSLSVLPSGVLVAAGTFVNSWGANKIASWDGSLWSATPAGPSFSVLGGSIYSLLVLPNGDLMAGGDFRAMSGAPEVPAQGVARWDGAAWSALANGIDGRVRAAAVLANGDLVVGGGFHAIGGKRVNKIARWDGSSWHALGSGITPVGSNSYITCMAATPDGSIVIGGWFTHAGGVSAPNRIARWDGTNWSSLGGGTLLSSAPQAVAVMQDGSVIVGGSFTSISGVAANRIARWNGNAWSSLGSGVNNEVRAIAVLPNGDVVAGGRFTMAGGVSCNRVARWDGANWHAMGSGFSGEVLALKVTLGGQLVAGGALSSASGLQHRVASWDGQSWLPMGVALREQVAAIEFLPNGDVLAGSDYAPTSLAYGVWRFSGNTSTLLTGNQNVARVDAIVALPSGEIVVGHDLWNWTTGGRASPFLAKARTTCLAAVNVVPTSCTSPSGPITLSANILPWAGGTFRSTATGMASTALAFSLLGFGSPGTPLSLITPLAHPGCDLLATPDSVEFLIPTAGSAAWQVAIPNGSSWVGVPLFHQFLQLDPTALGSVSSSNGLALVVGSF